MNKKLQTVLSELEKTQSTFWNISRPTAIFINSIIKESGYKTALEIGTSNGYSGLWIAEALSHNKGHLYTMESHAKGRYALGEETFEKSGLKKYITHILGHAPEAIPETPKKIDLLFLDATKEEYVEHFDALKDRIRKGGMIIADNLYSHPLPLKPFVEKINSTPGWKVYEMAIGTGLLIGIKA
jgi:predicted O-methyltransferase YrrM